MNFVLLLTLVPMGLYIFLLMLRRKMLSPDIGVKVLRLTLILCVVSPILYGNIDRIIGSNSLFLNLEFSPDTPFGALLILASKPYYQTAMYWVYFAFLLGMLLSFAIDLFGLAINSNNSRLYKKIGRVEIRVSKNNTSPFVYSHLRRVTIVLPNYISRRDRYISVKHELSHIRHGDLYWNWSMYFWKMIFGWNPIFWIWKFAYEHLCETRSDLETIDRYKIARSEYLNSLISIAKSAQLERHLPNYASALPGKKSFRFYSVKSRILNIQKSNLIQKGPATLFMLSIIIAAANVAGSSFDISTRSWSLSVLEKETSLNRHRYKVMESNNTYGLIMSY